MRLAAFQNASVKLHKKRGRGISGRIRGETHALLFFKVEVVSFKNCRRIEICVILLK